MSAQLKFGVWVVGGAEAVVVAVRSVKTSTEVALGLRTGRKVSRVGEVGREGREEVEASQGVEKQVGLQ